MAAASAAVILIRRHYFTTETIEKFPSFQHVSNLNPNGPQTYNDSVLPDHIQLAIPFTPQAPTANWDELHNEGCEEASAIMAAFYFSPPETEKNNEAALDPKIVESEISKLTDWQQQTFGYHLSINTEETSRMVEEVYGLETEIIKNFTADDIKKALAKGKLVLLPANGRLLKNPYYKQPGPIYHMLVIRGYNSAGFITNDPGTKRGKNYFYSYETLNSASGNWSRQANAVDQSQKQILLVWKQ